MGNLSAYAATKGAIDTLVKHLAMILGPRGVRVNAVAPGVVETDMSSFAKTDAGRDFALGMQALKRVAQPDDIADAIAFLASDAARWVSRRHAARRWRLEALTDQVIMSGTNKALVLEAFDTLFNHRDYAAAERFWSPDYVQHSAHIAPGRAGLVRPRPRVAPDSLRYEHRLIMAEGDFVMVHGRFSGTGRPAAWIAVDILRIEDGRLAEHWDVLQDEATSANSVSGLPMFGAAFPA